MQSKPSIKFTIKPQPLRGRLVRLELKQLSMLRRGRGEVREKGIVCQKEGAPGAHKLSHHHCVEVIPQIASTTYGSLACQRATQGDFKAIQSQLQPTTSNAVFLTRLTEGVVRFGAIGVAFPSFCPCPYIAE